MSLRTLGNGVPDLKTVGHKFPCFKFPGPRRGLHQFQRLSNSYKAFAFFSYFVIYPFDIESDVRRGFAQEGGRSTIEFKKFADFYNITYEGLEIWVVLVTPKRNGHAGDDLLITQELLDEVGDFSFFFFNP